MSNGRSGRQGALVEQRRILIVSHGYPPRQQNGGELHVQRKARWWTRRGHIVRVVAADAVRADSVPFGASELTVEEVDGIEVHRLRFAVPDASRPFLDTYRNPMLEEFIEEQVNEFEPHLVYQVSGYIFGVTPVEIAAKHDIAAALFVVDYWHACPRITLLRPDGDCCDGPRSPADCATCRVVAGRAFNVLGSRANSRAWDLLSRGGDWVHRATALDPIHAEEFELRRDAISRALEYAGLVVANSRFLAGKMRALGVPDDRVLSIRQGLDVAYQREPPTPHAGFNVLFLGQLSYHKGIDLLIDAVNSLAASGNDITLRAFGPSDVTWPLGPSSQHVQIHGSVPYDDIWRELRNADVLVVPSRWYENSPNVILEAQALGVPVIAADHGGMAEMVRDGVDGLLFRPGDAGSLEHALHLLVSDRELLAHLRANAPAPNDIDIEMAAEERAINTLLRAEPVGVA